MEKYTKNLDKEFSLINELFSTESHPQTIKEEDSKFYMKDKKFIFEKKERLKLNNSEIRNYNINNEYFILNSDLTIKILDSMLFSYGETTKFRIHSFSNSDIDDSKKSFHRCVIYNENIKSIRFDLFFSLPLLIRINGTIFEGIEFDLKNYNFQIYKLNDFFIIDCINEIDYKIFNKYVRIILGCYGFITGFAPKNKIFYFAYDNFNTSFKDFVFLSNFGDTYKSHYSLIEGNEYEYYQYKDLDFNYDKEIGFKEDERISNLKKESRQINKDVFENFCLNLIEKEQFAEVVFCMLDINNVSSNNHLFLKGASYSTLLEMFSDFIVKEHPIEKTYSIKDKSQRKNLRDTLHKTAKNFYNENEINDYENSPIYKNIARITKSTNKDMLKAPFKILGLELTDNEEKIIEYRNDFLHGRNPYKGKEISIQLKNLQYINLELNFLIQALILKYVGFNGIVKNLSKIYLDYKNIEKLEDEDYFKKI